MKPEEVRILLEEAFDFYEVETLSYELGDDVRRAVRERTIDLLVGFALEAQEELSDMEQHVYDHEIQVLTGEKTTTVHIHGEFDLPDDENLIREEIRDTLNRLSQWEETSFDWEEEVSWEEEEEVVDRDGRLDRSRKGERTAQAFWALLYSDQWLTVNDFADLWDVPGPDGWESGSISPTMSKLWQKYDFVERRKRLDEANHPYEYRARITIEDIPEQYQQILERWKDERTVELTA